ncbi:MULTISPECIES: hypothetical protein [unclassified Pseudofrankia]|uniref:hypothetical protein n=1 Tax=unclassified Pseudofrankia TaxID=2994372 RepID=UPI0008DAD94C|nr:MULTISPECIES: hypothetical protein [unclassified Pseudofrankia]MDT3446808.1 hypothetical protein [Pseudofrankia sp. BMG5.37]OHV57160.1 hypothetical protein BCD48_43390 [Pseudofrankia sp. BMG5.36]
MDQEQGDHTARRLIDEAAGELFGARREQLLLAALARVEQAGVADAEARAVTLALLAQQDPAYLDRARATLDQLVGIGASPHWALVHLAEACLHAGQVDEALRYASEVDRGFFERRDLLWRSVRMDEIRAAALLRLGDLEGGTTAALAVCDVLTDRGDSDDLAPPADLVAVALTCAGLADERARAAGCRILDYLSGSLELGAWFPAETVHRIRSALADCARYPAR